MKEDNSQFISVTSKTRPSFRQIGFGFGLIVSILAIIFGYRAVLSYQKKETGKATSLTSGSFELTVKAKQIQFGSQPDNLIVPTAIPTLVVNSWKEFNNPKFSFSFKYPEGWFEKINVDQSVVVSNYPDECSKCIPREKRNYYALVIYSEGELAEKDRTDNAKILLLKAVLVEEERCANEMKKTGKQSCEPVTPGVKTNIADTNIVFEDKGISAVEVSPYVVYGSLPASDGEGLPQDCADFGLIVKEYFLLKINHQYRVGLIGPPKRQCSNNPEFGEDHLLIGMIKNLKFK